jgi:2-oxoglutarate/2-oxoacid ferredoxin oxidoreductase subunit alpha
MIHSDEQTIHKNQESFMGQDITILIGGAAGQGIQTIGSLLAGICHQSGLFIFSYDDFQSRIRGGHSFHLLRVADQPLTAPGLFPDILVAMDSNTVDLHGHRLTEKGIALLNKAPDGSRHDQPDDTAMAERQSGREDDRLGNRKERPADKVVAGQKGRVVPVPLEDLAKAAGGRITANTVAAGVVAAMLGTGISRVRQAVEARFGSSGHKVLAMNLAAAEKGYDAGRDYAVDHSLTFSGSGKDHIVMSGARAAALGALAADCRFFPFYPMSPGTPIITHLAAHARDLPIVVEQAEDEIAAVNMAIGASYAGVRSLTATSGGGFSLMVEGLGLAGISETPIVIINAQRPGPATGLATRTAQADLLFAVHASQDEFPRFVFAPGSALSTFHTVKKAVRLSQKYQVPAIVLMDQYLVDSAMTEPRAFDLGDDHLSFLETADPEKETQLYRDDTYQRYRFTSDGISPRIHPCTPAGLVRVAGNEHSPAGFPDENPENRVAMMDKRFKKLAAMTQEMALPDVFSPDSSFFLTGWGSTRGSIMEACQALRRQGVSVGWILFEDLWPLDGPNLAAALSDRKMILVEGNATGQLGTLIRSLTGILPFSFVGKYDGRPIYPAYIIEKVRQIQGVVK